jgi:phosphate transport system substrate-binding protein
MLNGEIEMLRRSTMPARGNRYLSVIAAFAVAIGLALGCETARAAPPPVLLFGDRDLGEAFVTGAASGAKLSDAAADQACAAASAAAPRFALVTRIPSRAELEACGRSAEADVSSVGIGREAVVLVAPAGAAAWSIRTAALYRAIGEHGGSKQRPETWSDVNSALPHQPIGLLAPPTGSRTEALFDELVMRSGCVAAAGARLPFDEQERADFCNGLRRDIPIARRTGGTDALKAWAASAPAGQVAVVSLSELRELDERVVPLLLDGALPTTDNLAAGRYPAAASVSLLIVVPHAAGVESRDEARKVAFDLLAEASIGPEGRLAPFGLIPLAPVDRVAARSDAVAILQKR